MKAFDDEGKIFELQTRGSVIYIKDFLAFNTGEQNGIKYRTYIKDEDIIHVEVTSSDGKKTLIEKWKAIFFKPPSLVGSQDYYKAKEARKNLMGFIYLASQGLVKYI